MERLRKWPGTGAVFVCQMGGAESIAIGIATVLTNVSVYRRLKHEAAQRLPRRWTEVADDLNELMNKL